MNRHRVLNIIKKVQVPGFSQERTSVFGEGKERAGTGVEVGEGEGEGRSGERRGEKYGEKI